MRQDGDVIVVAKWNFRLNGRPTYDVVMVSSVFLLRSHVALSALTLFLLLVSNLWASPGAWQASAAATKTPSAALQRCLQNCRHCQNLYREYFRGHLCRSGCQRFRGGVIPDCLDSNSIRHYVDRDNHLH